MRIALAALLAGSLGASQIVLAQAPTTTAPSTAPSTAPTPPPSSSEATTAPASPSTSGAQPSPAAPTQPTTPMKQMTVSDLTDKDLMGARDNEVGEIEGVVESIADKKQHLVISRGGFLGLFETEVLVPLENVVAQGDRIVLRNLTEEQVKALPRYTKDDKSYRELDDSQTVSLSELK
jgi:sporulation protein YlmC with PRC-barrel domain